MSESVECVLKSLETISLNSLLTDSYQISMAYALWQAYTNDPDFSKVETFELFFRKNPFGGTYAIAGGMNDAIKYISNWKITKDQIELMKQVYVDIYSDSFYDFLQTLDSTSLSVESVLDGDVVFANEPLMSITGNFILVQLLETTLLNLIGHSTLICTLAGRIRYLCPTQKLLEFGCRRAQGASGALNSAKYSYIGGFDGTSNVLAGALWKIPVSGTNAHSFIMRFVSIDEVSENLVLPNLIDRGKQCTNFKRFVLEIKDELGIENTNIGELGAFIQYAYSYPTNFLTLVDTYNTIISGVPNYCCVAIALIQLGYKPIGIRLDSGNLATLSVEISKTFEKLGEIYPEFLSQTIVASNDLDEESINEMLNNGSKCGALGIGTNLATSKKQPSLGCVYKLVDRGGIPRFKRSEEKGKSTIPGKKYIFRLFDENNMAIADVMTFCPTLVGLYDKNNEIELFDIKNQENRVTFKFVRYVQVLKSVIHNGILNKSIDFSVQSAKDRCFQSIKTLKNCYMNLESSSSYFVGMDSVSFEIVNKITTIY